MLTAVTGHRQPVQITALPTIPYLFLLVRVITTMAVL